MILEQTKTLRWYYWKLHYFDSNVLFNFFCSIFLFYCNNIVWKCNNKLAISVKYFALSISSCKSSTRVRIYRGLHAVSFYFCMSGLLSIVIRLDLLILINQSINYTLTSALYWRNGFHDFFYLWYTTCNVLPLPLHYHLLLIYFCFSQWLNSLMFDDLNL